MARLVCAAVVMAMWVTACSPVSRAADSSDAVDNAVDALQALDTFGGWRWTLDGLIDLDADAPGYSAALRAQSGPLGGEPDAMLTLTVQVDAAHTALIESGTGEQYYAPDYRAGLENPRLYRRTEGGYVCVTGDAAKGWFLDSIFAVYMGHALGPQTLAVVEEADDVTLLDRDAIAYDIVSKLPEALSILSELNHADLRAQGDAAADFDLSGTLTLDADTLAMLHFDGAYVDRLAQRVSSLTFTVTRWGRAQPIDAPPALPECE